MSDSGVFRRDHTERRAVLVIAGALCALGALSSEFPWTCGLVAGTALAAVGLRLWLAHRAHVARIEAAIRDDEARAERLGAHQVLRPVHDEPPSSRSNLGNEADPGSWAA